MADSKGFMLGLLAETPLHPGTGQSAGVVDLPVAREGTTGLPHIPETSVKGALRQWAEGVYGGKDSREVKRLFGTSEAEESDGKREGGAGDLLISAARLLFLPIRRLDGAYAWTTTPYLLERLGRDGERAKLAGFDMPRFEPQGTRLLLSEVPAAPVFLEEYVFDTDSMGDGKAKLRTVVGKLVEAPLCDRLMRQAAVMHDDEFGWFAENALPVDARNSLDDAKMSQNLWYEETLPPDTLLYTVILTRSARQDTRDLVDDFKNKLKAARFVQAGGNETVGHGWLRLAVVEG